MGAIGPQDKTIKFVCMSTVRNRVFAHVKQDRLVLSDAESATPWTGSTDVSSLTTTTTHREGTVALSFAKSGTTESFGQISTTLDSDTPLNLIDYLDGVFNVWISLSSLTNIASVSLIIGESASHNYVYTIADSSLTTGYQLLTFDASSPSSTTGNGAAWSSINYIAVRVTFDAVGNTLSDILVDAISAQYKLSTRVDELSITGTGLSTEAKQDIGNTALSAIQTAVEIMDDWDESDRAKTNIIVGQAGISAGAGSVAANTPRVTHASDDPVTTALQLIDDAVFTDDTSTFTPGTTKGMAIGGVVDESGTDTADEGDIVLTRHSARRAVKVDLDTQIRGEDETNNLMRVEQRFSYNAVIAADTQIKASAGFLHSVTFSCNDAAPTAGSIIIYDNTAESGTQVFNHTFTTTPFVPFTVMLNITMTTGIYVGFTTTNDVNVSVSYR